MLFRSFEMESLHQHQVVRALKEMRVDIGLVFDPPPSHGIAIEHLASAEMVAVTRDTLDLAGKSRLTLDDLVSKPFIQLSSRGPLGQLLENHFRGAGVEMQPVARVETYQMAKSLVAHGAGVALIDEITARSSGHDKVMIRRLDPSLHFDIAIMHAESDPISVVTQRFITHLKAEIERFFTSRPLP